MKTYDEALNEAAEKYAEYPVQMGKTIYNHVKAEDFKAGAAFGLAWQKQREEKLIQDIKKVVNKMGLDIKMVEYETVWGDANNIKKTLEITQEVRIKHFTDINYILKSHEENGD